MRQFMRNVLTVSVLLIIVACGTVSKQATHNTLPTAGIYDGMIGTSKVILQLTESSETKYEGFFVPVRGNSREERFFFALENRNGKLFVTFGEKVLKTNWTFKDDKIRGKIKLPRTIADDLGINRKAEVMLALRKTTTAPVVNKRYNEPVFASWREIDNITYGKSHGYWTRNADVTKPYIAIMASGMFKMLTGNDELELQMDYYEPKDDSLTIRPLVLLIHGGAFYIGYKECNTIASFARELARRGFAVAAIDYRMGFKMNADDVERSGYKATQDAHAALRYLAHNASFFKISPTDVYVAGSSAGAITALNVAFLDENERPKSTIGEKKKDNLGAINSTGNAFTETFDIKGVVNMWGAVSDTSIIGNEEKIPVLSFHGTSDLIVPYAYDYPFNELPLGMNKYLLNKVYGSSEIHKRLTNLGVQNKLVTMKDLGHEPVVDEKQNLTPMFDSIRSEMYQFLASLATPNILPETNYEKKVQANQLALFKPVVQNGKILAIKPIGGVVVDESKSNPEIIWFSDAKEHSVQVFAGNHLGSSVCKTLPIKIK